MESRISDWGPRVLRRALRFVLPDHCSICGSLLTDDPIPHFCASCWSTVASMPSPRCARCDRPFSSPMAAKHSPNRICQPCLQHPPSYTRAWSLLPYTTPLRDAICLFKYRGKVSLASSLATLMIERLPSFAPVDVIMPVPLHPQRLRQREFNQSLLLAERVGDALSLPICYTNLIRTIPSLPQTTLSQKRRRNNLRGAFAVRYPDKIRKKCVLLIDDVFTTGTTVNECAKSLRKAGSADVLVLTLGRTLDFDFVPDRLRVRHQDQLGILGA